MVTRRMNRIFRNDGRTLIFAMEHAGIFGPMKGLDKPGETIARVISGGVDAIMTSYGIARHFNREISPVGLILRSDGASTILDQDVPASVWFGVEEALRLGTDALCISTYPGDHKEIATLNNLAETTRRAHEWGLPIQAELVPFGMGSSVEQRSLENIRLAARLGIELGRDWVKTPYVDGFEKITEACYKPVVIMGGKKRAGELDILYEMRKAMDGGAAGGTIGRNIFQSDHPEGMARALAAIIHKDASVEESIDIYKTSN